MAPTPPGDPAVLDAVGEVLSQVRRKKTEAKVSQRAAVERLDLVAPADFLAALASGEDDLRAAGGIAQLDRREGAGQPSIEVHLAPPTA